MAAFPCPIFRFSPKKIHLFYQNFTPPFVLPENATGL
jgi:hypothetical protein